MAVKSLEDYTVDELRSAAAEWQGKANLLGALSGNPETREGLQRLIKKASPTTVIPEIDGKDAAIKLVTAQNETIAGLERKLMEREARDNVKERREAIKGKYHLSDDDITKIEAKMVEDKEVNWTHDAAARVYLAETRTAEPTPATFSPPTFTMPEKDVWGAGLGNPARLNKIAMNQAFEAYKEISSGKVSGRSLN